MQFTAAKRIEPQLNVAIKVSELRHLCVSILRPILIFNSNNAQIKKNVDETKENFNIHFL